MPTTKPVAPRIKAHMGMVGVPVTLLSATASTMTANGPTAFPTSFPPCAKATTSADKICGKQDKKKEEREERREKREREKREERRENERREKREERRKRTGWLKK